MERETWIFWIVWFSIVVLLALIVVLNLNTINNFISENIHKYGYPAVFVLGGLTDAVDQPIGPEVVSGFATGFGLDALYVFILVFLGSFLVTNIHYYIGKHYLAQKITKSCSTKQYANTCKLFHKYGAIVLLLGALTPVPYVFSIWLSAAFGVKYKMFLIFGPLARAFRIGLIALIVAGII